MKAMQSCLRHGANAAAVVSVGVVSFLALRSSPWVGEVNWIPHWLSDWADSHGNFRNFPAFAALDLVLMGAFGTRRAAMITAFLGVGLECAQFGIRGRTFDWADIVWSLAGVAFASVLAIIWRYLCARNQPCSPPVIAPNK